MNHLENAIKLIREPEDFNIKGYLTEELAKFDYKDPSSWILHRGKYEQALDELKKALDENPNSVDANEYMGNLLVTLGKFSDALPYYNKISNHSDQTPIQLNIGALLETLGERHKTFDYYRWAAHNPELSILAGFLLAFPLSELNKNESGLKERLRNWLNDYLDKELPAKEEKGFKEKLLRFTRNDKHEITCYICQSENTGLFYEDGANHRKIRQCLDCKTIYVGPQPTFQEITDWYGSRYFEPSLDGAKHHLNLWKESMDNGTRNFHPTGKQFSLVFQWMESLGLKEIETQSPKPIRMLDIGCATGGLLAEFISRGWEAHGVELSATAVKFDKEMGFNVVQGTVQDGKYPDGYFDLITMTHVIEHLPDPVKTIKEIARILKKGGRLLIRTPNAESLPRLIAGKEWFGDHDHLFFFGNRTLNYILNKCNFKEIGVKSYVGIDIETYRVPWDKYRFNDTLRARINQAELGDVIILYAEYQGA